MKILPGSWDRGLQSHDLVSPWVTSGRSFLRPVLFHLLLMFGHESGHGLEERQKMAEQVKNNLLSHFLSFLNPSPGFIVSEGRYLLPGDREASRSIPAGDRGASPKGIAEHPRRYRDGCQGMAQAYWA
jgi:hypothetical protein